jgi:hypothetical protein
MKPVIALAVLALLPSMLPAAERICAMRGGRTADALKSDLELSTEEGIDATDVRTIGACLSYAFGYLDAAMDMGVASGAFSVADGVTRGQIRDIYLKWAKAHPDKLHAPAFICVIGALSEAAPRK